MPSVEHRGLLSRWMTFIITIDDPLDVVDRAGTRCRYDALVAGLDDQV